MTTRSRDVVERWFRGLNDGNLTMLMELFSSDPRIRIKNAANPAAEGTDAPRLLLVDFFARTSCRRFEVIDVAEGDGQIFAAWDGELTFPTGVQIAEVVLKQPLTVRLRGVERFQLDASGQILQLDIVHETTSVVRAARATNI